MKLVNAAVTITDAGGRTFDLTGDFTYDPAAPVLVGDLPDEGVDTVRWSEPIPMSASLTVEVFPLGGRWPIQWIALPQKGQHAPRMASAQCRRARRTAATKRRCLFNRRKR